MALLIEYFVCHDRSIKRDDLMSWQASDYTCSRGSYGTSY